MLFGMAVKTILGVLSGICTVLGILAAIGILPSFISGSALVGSAGTTMVFFWSLAALLLLATIAVAVARSSWE